MNFVDHIDWLEPNQQLAMAHFDHARMNYIEAPSLMAEDALLKFRMTPSLFVGRNSGVGETCILYSKTVIGRYCSIAHLVQIGGMSHRMEYLSTGYLDETNQEVFTNAISSQYSKFTQLGCDVWVGGNVVILRDVTIGHGACVGAGSVVTRDVPPYAIVAGTPAKVIRYRFPEHIVAALLELKWWTLAPEVIKRLPYQDVDRCIEALKEIRSNELLK